MSETAKLQAKIAPPEEVEAAEVPDKGRRVYLDEDHQWIVKKMDVPTYKMVKKLIAAGKETEAAQFAIKASMVIGTCNPQDIDDPDFLMGLESGVAELMNPVTAQVKKS